MASRSDCGNSRSKYRPLPDFPTPLLDDPLKVIANEELEVFSRRSEVEFLDEFVRRDHSVALPGSPAFLEVLDAFAVENDLVLGCQFLIQYEAVDDLLVMKLSKYQQLPGAVVAEETPIIVDLAPRVLLLWRVTGGIPLVKVCTIQDE